MDPTGGWALWTLAGLVVAVLIVWIVLPIGWSIAVTIGLCAIVLVALGLAFSNANYH